MPTRLIDFGRGDRRSIMTVALRLLTGDIGDALVEGVLAGRDRGRITDFVRKLRAELATVDAEFRDVNGMDRAWVTATLETAMEEIASEINRDKAALGTFLSSGLRGPYALAHVIRSTRVVGQALAEPASESLEYLAWAIDALASILSEWIVSEDGSQPLVQSHGLGELLRVTDSIAADLDNAVEALDELGSQRSRVSAQVIRAHYVDIIRNRAPDPLIDRAFELDLAKTLLESDQPVLAWVAPEKAGKSGLMYSLASRGIEGAAIVPFFIRQRDASSNSLSSFLLTTGAFLATEVGDRYGPGESGGLEALWYWRDLLHRAAFACRSRGVQLALLVDGLDEEIAHFGGLNAQSIASVLPELDSLRATGVKVIVTSRPNPPVPGDVAAGHWLSMTESWTELAPSPIAASAVDPSEIDELMRSQDGSAIVSLLAVAGYPLTLADMALILGVPVPTIRGILASGSSRNLVKSSVVVAAASYELGHESTLVRIVQNLSPAHADVPDLRDRPDWGDLRVTVLRESRRRVFEAATRSAQAGWRDCGSFLLSDAFVRVIEADEALLPDLVNWLVDDERHRAQRQSGMPRREAAEQILQAARRWRVQNLDDLLDLARLMAAYCQVSPGGLSVPLGATEACIAAGELDRALRIASRVETSAGSAKCCLLVAEAALDVGDTVLAGRATESAEESVSRMSWRGSRVDSSRVVSEIYERLGRPADAKRAAEELVANAAALSAHSRSGPPASSAPTDLADGSSPPSSTHGSRIDWDALASRARELAFVRSRDAALEMLAEVEGLAREQVADAVEPALFQVAQAYLTISEVSDAIRIYGDLIRRAAELGSLRGQVRVLDRTTRDLCASGLESDALSILDRFSPALLVSQTLDWQGYIHLATAFREAGGRVQAVAVLTAAVDALQSWEKAGSSSLDHAYMQVVDGFVRLSEYDAAGPVVALIREPAAQMAARNLLAWASTDPDVARLELEASVVANPFESRALWLNIASRHASQGRDTEMLQAVAKAWSSSYDYTCGWELVEKSFPGSGLQLARLVPAND